MIGLTYGDNLTLSPLQWGLVCVCPCLPHSWQMWGWVITWAAFFDIQIGRDQNILWEEIHNITARGESWHDFKQHYSNRRYINWQNPWITYSFSLVHSFCLLQGISLMCHLALGVRITPLTLIMMTQPSHDWLAMLCFRAAARKMGAAMGAAIYGIALIVKPSSLCLAPLMLNDVNGSWNIIIGILMMMMWSKTAGKTQASLMQHLALKGHRNETPFKLPLRGRWRTMRRRWTQYRAIEVYLALIFYLFPAWLEFGWAEWACVIALGIAPNIKYFAGIP